MTNNKKSNAVVVCTAELLIGILLLVKPVEFTAGIIMAVGMGLMVKGAMNIISYFKTEPHIASQQNSLAKGIILLLTGCICTFKTEWLLSAFPFMAMVYGVMLLMIGIQKLQTAVDGKRLGNSNWHIVAITSILSIVCSVVIFLSPFSTAVYLWMFTGISLIAEAVADIVAIIVNRKVET